MIAINVILCTFVQLTLSKTVPLQDPRIFYGELASIKDFPFFAAIEYCGASILSEHWLLTAGHCVDSPQLIGRKRVFVGHERREASQVYKFDEVIIHPKYTPAKRGYISYDIALLKMHTPLNFTENVRSVKLPVGSFINRAHTFVGRGKDETGKPSASLMKMNVNKLSSQECLKGIAEIYQRFFADNTLMCGMRPDSRPGMCMGDSGSPLVQNGAVIGLASFITNRDCNRVNKGYYTNVAAFVPWIKQVTGL